MQKLRCYHLYLGCIFAPLLLFFAVSGIWQTVGLHSHILERLSTIHTSRVLKSGDGFTNFGVKLFVLVTTLSFIATTIIGVVMALKFGRSRRATYYCLACGIVLPLVLIILGQFK